MTRNSSEAGIAESTWVNPALESGAPQISDAGVFFGKFLTKGLAISSAVPSSASMVSEVLRHVDFTRPSTIVELGAGTGPITDQVLDQLRPHHRFAALEKDADFCQILRRRFPGLPLIQGDVAKLGELSASHGIGSVDYVLSGLPTPNLPTSAQVRLWRWLRAVLKPDGLFLQITVAPFVYRKFYRRFFESVEYKMVWMNCPPGGVYRCARPRRHLCRAAS